MNLDFFLQFVFRIKKDAYSYKLLFILKPIMLKDLNFHVLFMTRKLRMFFFKTACFKKSNVEFYEIK